MRIVRRRPGVTTTIEHDRAASILNARTETAIPHRFLQRLHERGCETGRAPLGDSHGGWQKCGEIPLALVFQKIPPDAWNDERAWAALANDPDLRMFRCDGGRRF